MSYASGSATRRYSPARVFPAIVHPFGSLAIPGGCADPAGGPIALRPILTDGLPLSGTKPSSIVSAVTLIFQRATIYLCDTLRYEWRLVKLARTFFDDYAD